MDILDSLTADYDQLRYLVTDITILSSPQRESLFKQLVNLQSVTAKAEGAALAGYQPVEIMIRSTLERADILEDLAVSISRTQREDVREAKMELYCDLVLRRIDDSSKTMLPELFDELKEEDRVVAGEVYEQYKEVGLPAPSHLAV